MAAAEFVVFGELIGQAGRVSEEMLNCDLVAPIAGVLRNEFFERVVEFEFTAIKQGHEGGYADWLRDGAEQEHRVFGDDFSEGAREGDVGLLNVKDGGRDLAFARDALENGNGLIEIGLF